MSNRKILVVDDDKRLRDLLQRYLTEQGFTVRTAENAEMMDKVMTRDTFELIVLDLMLPEVDGLEGCKILRRTPATAGIPIIMLTARAAEMDRVIGLELGADDYVVKPFSPRELVIRIRKLIERRAPAEPNGHMQIGEIEIDVPAHELRVAGTPVTVTATEFKLLEVLASRCGRVQSRDRLLQDVWGYESPIDTRTVDTHMRRLREKLGDAAKYLETVRGVGYRFIAES